MKAIILAAGKGERMGSLTENLPKPLIPVGDKPLLEYNLKLLKKNNIKDIGINTSYLPGKIKNAFGNGSKWDIKIHYSFESKLLGTSGSLNNFRDFLNEDFFVIYGDNLTNINLIDMRKYHIKKGGIATIFLQTEKMKDEKTTPGFVIVDEKNQIKQFLERPTQEEIETLKKIPKNQKYNNSGIYYFNKSILNYISLGKSSDFCMDVFPRLLEAGEKIYGYTSNCFFRELGSLKRYYYTLEEVRKNKLNLETLI